MLYRNLNEKQLIDLLETGRLRPEINQGKITDLSNFQDRKITEIFAFESENLKWFGRARAIVVFKNNLNKRESKPFQTCLIDWMGLPRVFQNKKVLESLIDIENGISIKDLDIIFLRSGRSIAKKYGYDWKNRPDYAPQATLKIVGKHIHGWDIKKFGMYGVG